MFKKLLVIIVLMSSISINALTEIDTLCTKCQEFNINFVEFCCTDINGTIKSVIRPIYYLKDALTYGLYLDGSSIPGCTEICNSDIHLKVDPEALIIKLPWHDNQIAMIRMFTDMYLDNNTPYQGDPRYILKKEVEAARNLGYEFLVGPEIEFYVLEKSEEKYVPIDCCKYADATLDFALSQALANTLNVLNSMELNVEKIHHEVGPGQFEISLHYDMALKIADRLGTVKQALSIAAQIYNKKVSFMPKPFSGKPGNGMHLNLSLYDIKNNCNAFYDPENPEMITPLAQSFIAGILKYVRELTLILNSSINSYKRIVKGYEAPVYVCCGRKNRSALIRLPHVNREQGHTYRLEIRSPDALCNPYLAFAALLHAGMEGIKNNYTLSDFIDENLYTMDEETRNTKNIASLPASFHEAVQAFEESSLMKDLLGEQLFFTYLNAKKKELFDFEQTVTDWELEQYQ